MGMVLRLKKTRTFCWIPKGKQGTAGFLLVEAVLGSLLLMTIITRFFLITSHSVKWIHMLHHRHELLLDARFSRIQIMNRLRYSEKRPIVSNDGSWLVSPSNWRIRVYQDAFVTMLSDGQLQDITENEISPKIGKIHVFPQGSTFFQERSDGLIDLHWYSEVRPYWRRDHIQLMEGGQNRYHVQTGILPYATYLQQLQHKAK